MRLILLIAWRNILRHRGKSLVIGAILFLGALLMTVGNGVISGMAAGVEKNIVNGFMGDLVLISDKQKSDNILFEMMGAAIEPVSNYKAIKEILQKQEFVDRFLPVGKNLAMVLKEDEATPSGAYLLGVDFSDYRKMFPDNFKLIEGRWPRPGERSLLAPAFARQQFYDFANLWLVPEGGGKPLEPWPKEVVGNLKNVTVSTNIVMMGMASDVNTTTDIRFPVVGVVKFGALNKIFGHFCLVDIESYRECLGYFTASNKAVEVPKEEKRLLDMGGNDLDSLFGSAPLVVSNARSSGSKPPSGATSPLTLSLSKGEPSAPANVEDGVYNLVFIKLKPGVPYREALSRLNRALADGKTGIRAIPWNKASGPIGSMALIIKSALFIFVTLLFCVAIIIIVNTLTMAALERTSELGMMRAVGARKSFIGGMFLGETAILSALFGGAGLLTGILAVKLIPLFKITSDNDMVQILYGGDVFHPLLAAPDIVLSLFQLAAVTVFAAVYPMSVARGITPLDAISKD